MKKVIYITGFLLLGILFLLRNASAEPDETTKKFMNEPASLFDLGMLEIQSRASEWIKFSDWPIKFGPPVIGYDSDKDQILIYIRAKKEFKTKDSAIDGCKNVFDTVRERAFVDPKTGKLYSERGGLAIYFEHFGQRSMTDEDVSNLGKKFQLICTTGIWGYNIFATAPLQSNKFYLDM